MNAPRKRTIAPVEAVLGVVSRIAEAAAAGALREGARRARTVMRDVDHKLGRVQRLAEGELEPCKRCGTIHREHGREDHAFVGGEPRPRRRRRHSAAE